MAESLTPAGCGSRRAQWVGILAFTVAAVIVAAAVGAVAGAIGSLLPSRPAVVVGAVGIIVVAALRETGVLRVPVPAIRRQVPESWRRRLPVPVWAAGYGAILGSGFGTYQPVATYWAVLGASVAVGDPVTGAVALGAFGLARGMMAAGPIGMFDLVADRGRWFLRAANAVVLLALAAALLPATADAQGGLPEPSGAADPAVSAGVTAITRYVPGEMPRVEVTTGDRRRITIPGVREASLSGSAVAVVTPDGIDVRRWRTGEVLASVAGQLVHPALAGRYLVYVELLRGGSRMVVRDLSTGRSRIVTRVGREVDLGRPSVSGLLVVWHEASGRGSRILTRRVDGGPVQALITTARRHQVTSPSLATGTLVWIEGDAENFWVRARRLSGGRTVTVARTSRQIAVTTATDGRRAWIGLWNGLSGRGRIHVVRLPAALTGG